MAIWLSTGRFQFDFCWVCIVVKKVGLWISRRGVSAASLDPHVRLRDSCIRWGLSNILTWILKLKARDDTTQQFCTYPMCSSCETEGLTSDLLYVSSSSLNLEMPRVCKHTCQVWRTVSRQKNECSHSSFFLSLSFFFAINPSWFFFSFFLFFHTNVMWWCVDRQGTTDEN